MRAAARLVSVAAAILLSSCSGGVRSPGAVGIQSPTSLGYSWRVVGSDEANVGTPIVFDPWVGTWPNVTLERAIVTITGAKEPSAVTLVPTAGCVSVSDLGLATFAVTQGNNGRCILVASDGQSFLPITADAGYPPGVPFQVELAGKPIVSPVSALAGNSVNLTVMFTILPSRRAPKKLHQTVYGLCATGPSTLSTASNPTTFSILAITPGRCFSVLSDDNTESDLVQFDVET